MNGRTPEERERARREREARRSGEPVDFTPPPVPQPSPPPRPAPSPRAEFTPPPRREPLVSGFPPPPPRDPEPGPAGPGPGARPHGRRRLAALVVFAAVLAAAWFVNSVFQPFAGDGTGEGTVAVEIPKGADVGEIGDLLAEKNVVDSARVFGWRAGWSGKSDDFKAGRYKLAEGMSYSAAIDQLAEGPNAGVTSVTVVEGRSRYEISQQVEALGLEGDYMAASEQSDALNPRRYGAPSGTESLEGFLFPATYELTDDATSTALVEQQLTAFKRNIGDVNMRYARSKNLTVFDIVTIASLIEREVSVPRERKLVAAVIYNRLKQGIPLGIDATTRFETRNWTEPLTNSVLTKDTPYNTRTNQGLPPGPIGNPGLASLQAAAKPAGVDYLYYVANPCKPGEHTFSTTQAEFEQDVERYNRAREAAGGKQPSGC